MRKANPGTIEARPRELVDTGGVSASSRSPLYHQIYLVLRDGILAGTYKVGDLLPSEHELTRLYGVSRITAKRALAELAAAGLVSRFRGRGTTVSYKPDIPPLRASVANWLQAVSAMGRATSVEVLEFGYGPANDEEANALQLAAGAEVQRSLRVRSHEAGPFSLLTTVVPAEIGRTYVADELAATPLLDLLARAGVAAQQARQVITATLANQAVAAHLQTEVGAPLIKLQRIVHDDADRPVEYLTALYRPDRYQLEMVLTSEQTAIDFGGPLNSPSAAPGGRR